MANPGTSGNVEVIIINGAKPFKIRIPNKSIGRATVVIHKRSLLVIKIKRSNMNLVRNSMDSELIFFLP